MRKSQAAIRGGRPTTRFAAPSGHSRAPHLGLRNTTPARLAQAPADSLAGTPLLAVRSAARGHMGLTRSRTATVTAAASPRLLSRPDAITWSAQPISVPRRARPRSAAPWRG